MRFLGATHLVILSRPGQGTALLERLKRWLSARGLTLNETKTRLVDIRTDGIKFLGFSVSWRRKRKRWWGYTHVEPHPKSQQKLRDGARELLNHWTLTRPEKETIRALNRKLRGWAEYFRHGNPSNVFCKTEYWLQNKVRQWLWKRHGKPAGKYQRYSNESLRADWGLYPLAYGGTAKPKANR